MIEELWPLADFARNLVVACGARLRERRRSISPAMREKGSYRDIVTDHDLWVQQYLAEALQKEAPFCGILGEGRRPPAGGLALDLGAGPH